MPRILFFVLALLSLIWGGSFFFIKVLLEDFGPWTIAFLRSSFGLATISVIMLILRQPFDFKKVPWIPMIAVSLLNTAVPWTLIAFSETKLTSSMASVMNATTPLWTMVIGLLFFQAVSNRQQWIGMGIAFVGLIILLDINTETIISVDLIGFLCMITATLFYAISSQLSKRHLAGLSMYQVAFGTLLGGLIGSGSIALTTESFALAQLASWSTIGILFGLGSFGSGVAYILYYYLIQKGTPEFASMVTYLVPASAIFWGVTLLNEEIHWSLVTGLVLILGGVFLAGKKRAQKKEKTEQVQEATSI